MQRHWLGTSLSYGAEGFLLTECDFFITQLLQSKIPHMLLLGNKVLSREAFQRAFGAIVGGEGEKSHSMDENLLSCRNV